MFGITGLPVRRALLLLAFLCLEARVASADVWMVKASGSVACTDKELLAEASSAARLSRLPHGCYQLYVGERLIEVEGAATGYADVLHVQLANGTEVYVSSSVVTADPGVGSLDDDRP